MVKRVVAPIAVLAVAMLFAIVSVTAMFFQFGSDGGGASGSANAACTAGSTTSLSVKSGDLPTLSGYSTEELSTAAQIMKAGESADVGERGQLIGLMTAMQESHLENLPGGDRDSVGAFQQRPSQGWGTAAQLQDPGYAATAFFQGVDTKGGSHIPGLVDVDGWEKMALTDAAAKVQRPAEQYAKEYAKHEDAARHLMAALADVPVSQASASLTEASLGCGTATGASTGDLPSQAQLTKDSANVACPKGTTDLGAASGGYHGKRIPIRLCSITGTVCTGSDCKKGDLDGKARGEVVLNSLVAPHFMAWLKDVRAAGADPTFSSSFRSWETQARLAGTGSANVAKLGYSNHQMGSAVDISGIPGSYNRDNCSGHSKDGACMSSSSDWKIYHDVGLKNGLAFHDEEFWHLEAIVTRADERDIPFIKSA